MKLPLALALAVAFFSGCTTDAGTSYTTSLMAYIPIYADTHNLRPVAIELPRPITSAGKIYVYGKYIFQNEQNEGIHIIDNSDASHPEKKAFLSIPFNTEMAIRSSYIYANSANDILVIDAADPLHPTVVNKIKNAFPMIEQNYPPDPGYFECPDPSKGVVIAWKLEQTNPKVKCRR